MPFLKGVTGIIMKKSSAISPGKKRLKQLYIRILLFFVGRALQGASKFDEKFRSEVSLLPDHYSIKLKVHPAGPEMNVIKEENSKLKFISRKAAPDRCDLVISIKNTEAAILLFTFRESTARAFARDRMFVRGDLGNAITFVRCLDIVEVYLLPKFIARLAVKRYPELKWRRILFNRMRLYIRVLI